MSNLWEPQNIHALPTPSETKLTNESIKSLEVQLQRALATLLQAQHAVEKLQQQIEERRAWIASIRRTSHDVLSLIFLEVCQVDWSAPLILGQVCHLWRESIIAYPKAWSYFQLEHGQSDELRSLFVSRSVPYSLHLRLPDQFDSRTSELLASVTERIQCLRLYTKQVWDLRGHLFPAMERLYIDGYGAPDQDLGFVLNYALFPRLRLLNVRLERITWDAPPFPNFVPLQVSAITAVDTNVWRNIVECCSHSLTSLALDLYPTGVDVSILSQKTITLPRLESLHVGYIGQFLPRGWFIARTPALQTYWECSSTQDRFVGPIHEDTQTVTSLYSYDNTDLSKFPQVRQMTLSFCSLHKVVQRLVKAPAICPNLDTIVYDQSSANVEDLIRRVKNLIAARNKKTGGKIQFRSPNDDDAILYQHPRERKVRHFSVSRSSVS